ncbi:carbohydrate-binding protein [Zobellia barbeyronii]|uniref:Carbohydrate-binding protein n=1 Tax=Zobellia barbeyronii TaxID=2748009 RepID=A0ABS5WE25_9FLAO|nr:carbohydrate-binding protein [Zobellia barbeyronii]MBT2161640.1 carbohydrate-binding protein [Zobellia barbeyronii]
MKTIFENSRSRLLASGAVLALVFAQSCAKTEVEEKEDFAVANLFSVPSSSSTIIQAEDYDNMNGVRTETTSDSGGGQNVGWIATGDYLEYDLNIANSGSYKMEFRVASKDSSSKFDFYQDNTKLSNVNKAATNGWQNWITTSKTVNLSAGSSTLKILATGNGWNINWIKITPVSVDAGNNADSSNLALGKSATQSSNYSSTSGLAGLAVDGNTSGVWSQGSVTHTSNMYQPWWQVQLGDDYTIGDIKIWNRTNCCSSRLSNFDVFVYNSAGTQVFKTTITSTPNPSVTVSTGGVSGSRVRIKLKGNNPLSLAEVQVFGASDDNGNGGGGTGTASIPSDLMNNCNQWKITYPDGGEDKTLCGEGNNEYFYVNDNKNGIVFRAPIRSGNGTTPNSDYVRSELRERTEDGKTDISWTTSGTNVVYVKQAITHLPIVKDHLVATQIHGNKADGIDDAMVLRLEGSKLFLSFNGGKLRSDLTIKSNYSLGTEHEVIFEVVNGKHYCYYSEDGGLKSAYASGNASRYLVKDGSNSYVMDRSYGEAYFKIGNYTQSNAEKEGSQTGNSNNYGEVVVYDFYVEH